MFSLFKRKPKSLGDRLNKSLFMGTLLLVGVFGVWTMTSTVVLASDEVVVESSATEEVVIEESAPAEEASDEEDEPAITETEETEESAPVVDEPADPVPVESEETENEPGIDSEEETVIVPVDESAPIDSTPEPGTEPTDESTTDDELTPAPEEEVSGDEGIAPVSEENDDSLKQLAPTPTGQIVISDEFGGDTENNNTQIDPNSGSEGEFTTDATGGNNDDFSGEYSFDTGNGSGCTTNCGGGGNVEEVISEEKTFNTLSDNPTTDPEVSAEYEFSTSTGGGGGCTSNCGGTDETVSDEYHFTTGGPGCTTNCGPDGVSDEYHFTTSNGGGGCTINCGPDDEVSDEYEFTTGGPGGCTTNCGPDGVSNEYEFTTTGGGGCTTNCGPSGVSDEYSFTTTGGGGCTTNCGPDGVSDEYEFTTDGGGGGCTSNCGGGGGGGGGGGRPKPKPDPELPYACPILLTKFIRLGENNDPNEVRKLEAFLIVFEGFTHLKVNGIYEYEDFLAVSEFQKRYGNDILGPWAITDSTGYVYITTTYAINNIYCNRSTANDLDLVFFYGAGGVIERIETIDTGTGATSTIYEREASDFLQIATVGMFDFIRSWWCLLDILLLLIILALMAYGWWNESRERAKLEKELALDQESFAKMAAAGAIPFVAVAGDETEEEKKDKDTETIYL